MKFLNTNKKTVSAITKLTNIETSVINGGNCFCICGPYKLRTHNQRTSIDLKDYFFSTLSHMQKNAIACKRRCGTNNFSKCLFPNKIFNLFPLTQGNEVAYKDSK